MSISLADLCDQICNGVRSVDSLSVSSFDANEWTSELATRLIANCAESIVHVPERLMTMDMWRIAVSTKPRLLQYTPDKFKSHEVCISALRVLAGCIRWVPPEMLTASFCINALAGYSVILAPVMQYIPETELKVLLPFLTQKCTHILSELRKQPKEICLELYQRSKWEYRHIRSDKHRRFVVRVAMTDLVVTIRAAGLSTNLLVEMFEQMGSALYPTLNLGGCPLTPMQIWSIVAAANHT
ncbi:MAG: hypothetical protein WC052_04510 [Patescibacteria group bacterium]